jgi:8-oxo-dGTP pyrophosphatase MutT (NUDIX family)
MNTAFSTEGVINVEELTRNQPFCAGVVLARGASILVTLNSDGLPEGLAESSWRVGGVGGGQEPGETISQCARREANEEICSDVRIISSPMSFFHDIDSGAVTQIVCSDTPAPLLLEREVNPRPDKPFRPGLPTGPYIYFGLFLAEALQSRLQPGDDVEGLLTVPLDLWPALEQDPTLQEMLDRGAGVTWLIPHATTRRLWLAADESFREVARLLSIHPNLMNWVSSEVSGDMESTAG